MQHPQHGQHTQVRIPAMTIMAAAIAAAAPPAAPPAAAATMEGRVHIHIHYMTYP